MTSTDGIRLGVVRGIQYGLVAKPDTFAPQARDLGAGLLRMLLLLVAARTRTGPLRLERGGRGPATRWTR